MKNLPNINILSDQILADLYHLRYYTRVKIRAGILYYYDDYYDSEEAWRYLNPTDSLYRLKSWLSRDKPATDLKRVVFE